MNSFDYDYIVIGAGVVGLAVAAELSLRGRVLVIEAAGKRGMGTSSRNSEVVHAGIYYPVGSLKARLCVAGRKIIESLAAEGRIKYQRVGKLIVAVEELEVKSLNDLYENARRCGVEDMERLDKLEIANLEPAVHAIAAVYSKSTGIVGAHSLMDYFFHRALRHDADFVYASPVTKIRHIEAGYVITVTDADGRDEEVTGRCLVNSAGLYADEVAQVAGFDPTGLQIKQVWAKGYYYRADGLAHSTISHLVYPVPLRPLDTLGVHATLDLGGGIKFGPTSGYLAERCEDYSLPVRCPDEVKHDIARYLPSIQDYTLEPIMAGIRAKLQKSGQAHRDFHIHECSAFGKPGLVNLCGIESPGLTAAPAIGKYVAGLLAAFH
jgi:L-2-hydroxyglutarate oxidase LhgO